MILCVQRVTGAKIHLSGLGLQNRRPGTMVRLRARCARVALRAQNRPPASYSLVDSDGRFCAPYELSHRSPDGAREREIRVKRVTPDYASLHPGYSLRRM